MDIRSTSSSTDGVGASGRVPAVTPERPTSGNGANVRGGDAFSPSEKLASVHTLIESLIQVPAVRHEVVERAAERMISGELDSPEAARAAAEG